MAALDVEEGARGHRRRVRACSSSPWSASTTTSSSATIPTALAANVLDQSTTVYYSDGKTVLGTIGTVDRQDLTINQIPKALQDAVIAAEDRGFWTEGGISPTGILRAAYEDVTGGSGGSPRAARRSPRSSSGTTTNADVGTQQTVSRKIKEIFIAQKLASSKSKEWILQNYMNVIYLGDGAYGVEAAARDLLRQAGRQADRRPGRGHRGDHPGSRPPITCRSTGPTSIARWHYVLNGMVTIGDLSQAQANSMKFPKLLTDSPSYSPPGLSRAARPPPPSPGRPTS